MSNLPENVEQHRPNPLSADVAAANRDGHGIHVVADNLAVLRADPADLPPGLRAAREEVEKAERARIEAEGNVTAGVIAWRHYSNMLDTLAAMRRDLAGGEQAVLDLRALVEKLPHDFEASWLVEEGVASFCVSNVS